MRRERRPLEASALAALCPSSLSYLTPRACVPRLGCSQPLPCAPGDSARRRALKAAADSA
eukprot:6190789-Pleurochrysis_carterae.AAC.2